MERYGSRLEDAIKEGKLPMVRCTFTDRSILAFFDEVLVTIEGVDTVVSTMINRDWIIQLNPDKRGSRVLDGYVRANIYTEQTDDRSYLALISGADPLTIRVAREQVVFASPDDPIWSQMRAELVR